MIAGRQAHKTESSLPDSTRPLWRKWKQTKEILARIHPFPFLLQLSSFPLSSFLYLTSILLFFSLTPTLPTKQRAYIHCRPLNILAFITNEVCVSFNSRLIFYSEHWILRHCLNNCVMLEISVANIVRKIIWLNLGYLWGHKSVFIIRAFDICCAKGILRWWHWHLLWPTELHLTPPPGSFQVITHASIHSILAKCSSQLYELLDLIIHQGFLEILLCD